MKAKIGQDGKGRVRTKHDTLEEFVCDFEGSEEGEEAVLLFTENETNSEVGLSEFSSYTGLYTVLFICNSILCFAFGISFLLVPLYRPKQACE